jgi:hypothetical protein
MNILDLKYKLIGLSYDAHIVEKCLKIHQKSAIHILTFNEAKNLVEYNVDHPIRLNDYKIKYGKNYFYYFE